MRPAPVCFRKPAPHLSGMFAELHVVVQAWAMHHAKCGQCHKYDWFDPSVTFAIVGIGNDGKQKYLEFVAKQDEDEARRMMEQLYMARVGNWRVWYRSLWPLKERLCAPGLRLFMRWAVTTVARSGGKALIS